MVTTAENGVGCGLPLSIVTTQLPGALTVIVAT
jgi:hypothetical protein